MSRIPDRDNDFIGGWGVGPDEIQYFAQSWRTPCAARQAILRSLRTRSTRTIQPGLYSRRLGTCVPNSLPAPSIRANRQLQILWNDHLSHLGGRALLLPPLPRHAEAHTYVVG